MMCGSKRSSLPLILLAFFVLLAPTVLAGATLGTYAITMGRAAEFLRGGMRTRALNAWCEGGTASGSGVDGA